MKFDSLKQDIITKLQLGKKFLSQLIPPSTKTADNIIGLELNSDFIKLAKLHIRNATYYLDHFAVQPLEPGIIVKDEIKDMPTLGNILKKLIHNLNLPTRNVAICINRSAAMIKNVMIDARLNEDELESRVWIEASRLFPNLINDIYLDYIKLNLTAENKYEIALVACRKEQLKPYIELLENIELQVKLIDVNSYVLERALLLLQPPEDKIIALLNIHFSSLTLIVQHKQEQIYTYEMNIDGHQLMKNLKENPAQANNVSGLPLRHMMQFYYSSRPNMNIEKLLLCGDCVAAMPDLNEIIQVELGITTLIADPINYMVLGEKINKTMVQQFSPALMLPLGLGLSKINI